MLYYNVYPNDKGARSCNSVSTKEVMRAHILAAKVYLGMVQATTLNKLLNMVSNIAFANNFHFLCIISLGDSCMMIYFSMLDELCKNC